MSNLEEIKERTAAVVDYGGEFDHMDVAWLMNRMESLSKTLEQEVELRKELETKLSICESAVEGDQNVKEGLSEVNHDLWNSVKVLRRDKNKWYDVASWLQEDYRRYKQALNKIANEMDGNLEGLDAERGLEEAKEIAAGALEDEE